MYLKPKFLENHMMVSSVVDDSVLCRFHPVVDSKRIPCIADIKAKSGPVRFGKNSIITFKDIVYTLRAPPASFTTEMTFRTRQTDSVLMHQLIGGLDAYLKVFLPLRTFRYSSCYIPIRF